MSQKKNNILVTCDVLRENLQNLLSGQEHEVDNTSIVGMINAANATIRNPNKVALYSTAVNGIYERFKIPQNEQANLKVVLETASQFYLYLSLKPYAPQAYEKYITQLNQIIRTAVKLRNQINSAGLDFADFLELVNYTETKDEGEPSAHDFLYDLVEKLRVIAAIKYKFNDTVFAKEIGYGVKGRPKHEAILLWVSALYNFWIQNLNRSMKRDKTGIGGRKKFLVFLDQCIEPLHPELMSYNSDALDTALKQVQKNIRHGEIASQK
ncbi:MAG: hypothetical protein ABJ275_02135 [Maricaulaceae bacterium]